MLQVSNDIISSEKRCTVSVLHWTELQIVYRQLEFALVYGTLPPSRAIGLQEPTTYIPALVQTCRTEPADRDAAHETVYYLVMNPSIAMNDTVQGVVECVEGWEPTGNYLLQCRLYTHDFGCWWSSTRYTVTSYCIGIKPRSLQGSLGKKFWKHDAYALRMIGQANNMIFWEKKILLGWKKVGCFFELVYRMHLRASEGC